MIPEIAETLGMSIHELYGIADSGAESKPIIERQKKTVDPGKISAYKIALLVGMFLCAIGGWIHECNSSGREVSALKRTTYVQGADKFGEAYLFYFPHGGELTETEVIYKIGTAGKILKIQTENSTTIMGNSYYFCYVEAAFSFLESTDW